MNFKLEKVNKIQIRKMFLVFSSKECTRISTRIFLVPVSVGQPNTQDLEWKKEEKKKEKVSWYLFLQFISTQSGTSEALDFLCSKRKRFLFPVKVLKVAQIEALKTSNMNTSSPEMSVS